MGEGVGNMNGISLFSILAVPGQSHCVYGVWFQPVPSAVGQRRLTSVVCNTCVNYQSPLCRELRHFYGIPIILPHLSRDINDIFPFQSQGRGGNAGDGNLCAQVLWQWDWNWSRRTSINSTSNFYGITIILTKPGRNINGVFVFPFQLQGRGGNVRDVKRCIQIRQWVWMLSIVKIATLINCLLTGDKCKFWVRFRFMFSRALTVILDFVMYRASMSNT